MGARAPQLLVGALVILIGVRGAFLLADLAGSPLPPIDTSSAPQVPAAISTRNVVDVASIQRANLFGQSVAPAGESDAPVTTMSLVLGGVTAAKDPKRGSAMIGTSLADIKFYRVGGSLPGGAQLHEVYRDRVLLDRGGTIEALLMPARLGLPPPPPPPVAAMASAAQVGRVQQIMRDNPNMLNQVLSRQAVFADGKLRGMRVYPGTNKQAFDKLGLKSGDLVMAINGLQLADQTKPEEVFNSLSNAAEANITVERNGTRQDLHLNLAEIANEAERMAQQGPATPGAPPGPEIAR